MESIFFPILIRRRSYSEKPDGKYYIYSYYYQEIEEDCQSRCVYCDSLKTELGGDNLQLDHFRPQALFPELENNPNNLVLSCARCNRLKSDYWPEGKNHHFIDPFKESRTDFFKVERTGFLTHCHVCGNFVIQLLQLNRLSRQNIRRKRIIYFEIKEVFKIIDDKLHALHGQIANNEIPRETILKKLRILMRLHEEMKQSFDFLEPF